MNTDSSIDLRLSIAVALITVWAFACLAKTPFLGDVVSPLPFILAPFLLWGRAEYSSTIGLPVLGALLLVVIAVSALGWFVSERSFMVFFHSPYFVVPVWLTTFWGLIGRAAALRKSHNAVRQIIERSEREQKLSH